MESEKIIDELYNIVLELDARECSNNAMMPEYSYHELCSRAIALLQQLDE